MPLFLLPILARLGALWRWLTADLTRLAFIILLALCAFLAWRLSSVDGDRDEWRERSAAEKRAHETTVSNYRAAALAAERIQQDNLARVEAERAAINERAVHDLQTARDTADARYRRLLQSAAAANSSGPEGAGMPPIADATCRAYAGTDCNAIPARLKAAQDNTDQLIALQSWVARQAVVATSPEVPDKLP